MKRECYLDIGKVYEDVNIITLFVFNDLKNFYLQKLYVVILKKKKQ